MAKKGKNCLVVDQSDLEAVKETYNKAAKTMAEIETSLDTASEELRKNWVSTGSKEFFTQFDGVWHENMKLYQQVLAHMSECLSIANDRYEQVFNEARKLDI